MTDASSFGYSLAFFNSDPELKSLLGRATSQNYTPDRFVAELRNTNWFQQHGEAYRKYTALKTGDPSTLGQMRASMSDKIYLMMQQMGADTSGIQDVTEHSLMFGWDDNQIKKFLAEHTYADASGRYNGQAGGYQQQIKQLVSDYGVDISDDTIGKWVQGSLIGVSTPETIKGYLKDVAKSKYVAFADRLNSGETMRQIADPYVQSMAKTLELNPEAVSLQDGTIQQALQSKDKDGKPAAQSVWQFEQTLRQDPRWMKTQNAQDSFTKTGMDVLKSFGLVS